MATAITFSSIVLVVCTYFDVTSSQSSFFDNQFNQFFGNTPRARNTFRQNTTPQSANSFRSFRTFFDSTPGPVPAPSFDDQFRNSFDQGADRFPSSPPRRDQRNRRRNRFDRRNQVSRPSPQFLTIPPSTPAFRSPFAFGSSAGPSFSSSLRNPILPSPFDSSLRPPVLRFSSQTSTQPPSPQPRSNLIPTAEEIAGIRRRANAFISQDDEWLPNLLQLAFHTCIGGCDGCLNPQERDNKGLSETYAAIRAFWNATQRNALSLADFIVLMATEAAVIGMFKADGDLTVLPSIEFRPGRLTCRDPDNYRLRHRFPKGDSKDSVQFLMNEFGFEDRKLAIALLGAHSLGACRQENLGFAGRWDNTPLILDNHYYRSMSETPVWHLTPISGTFQWNSSEIDGPMMLHADLALLHDFQLDENNRPSCSRSIDCGTSRDSVRVSIYASSNAAWIQDFTEAFLQMCDNRPAFP